MQMSSAVLGLNCLDPFRAMVGEVICGQQPTFVRRALRNPPRDRAAVERFALRLRDLLERAGVGLATKDLTRARRAAVRGERLEKRGEVLQDLDRPLPRPRG